MEEAAIGTVKRVGQRTYLCKTNEPRSPRWIAYVCIPSRDVPTSDVSRHGAAKVKRDCDGRSRRRYARNPIRRWLASRKRFSLLKIERERGATRPTGTIAKIPFHRLEVQDRVYKIEERNGPLERIERLNASSSTGSRLVSLPLSQLRGQAL